MDNILPLVVISVLTILSYLIKSKKAFLISNLVCVSLFVIFYGIFIYLGYTYAFEYVNTYDMDSLFWDAQRKFNNLIYHFIAALVYFGTNTVVIVIKLNSKQKPAV